MQILRADTAINVKIGVAVAVADGLTPVTNLSLATADEAELLKSNTTATASIAANAFGAITNADGWYWLTLSAGNVDTEGLLTICINDDDLILPLWGHFMVMSVSAFDALFGAAGSGYIGDITTIKQVLTGNWAIINNQLIMYDTDGTTALYTFNLTQGGTASSFNPDKREVV